MIPQAFVVKNHFTSRFLIWPLIIIDFFQMSLTIDKAGLTDWLRKNLKSTKSLTPLFH